MAAEHSTCSLSTRPSLVLRAQGSQMRLHTAMCRAHAFPLDAMVRSVSGAHLLLLVTPRARLWMFGAFRRRPRRVCAHRAQHLFATSRWRAPVGLRGVSERDSHQTRRPQDSRERDQTREQWSGCKIRWRAPVARETFP